jgi:predicted PurR-regulated permease PerM
MDRPISAPTPQRFEVPPPGRPGSALTTLAICAAVIALLYFGREILVPFALAVLLSFVLAPGVRWLGRWYIGRVTSVIVMVVAAFIVIFGFGAVIATQVATLGGRLPQYEWIIRSKIRSLQDAFAESSFVDRASRMLQNLSEELERPERRVDPFAATGSAEEPAPEPLPVEIQEPEPRPLQVIQSIIEPLVQPTATTGIVIIFVIFILLQRQDLRDRLIRLVGTHDLHRTTQAITDAAERVSRYLLMQTILNAAFGVVIGIGLWVIGVPNPILWGILAMVLRYVPFIGPIVAAAFPIALSLAVDPGWTMLLWTAALFLVVELIVEQVMEPWLYGSSTGLSTVAIIAAATFWTWLWGPIGLLLSTPLTACIVVLGRHVPQLQFLDVALGSTPVLSAVESFYQRMLAQDSSEAAGQAEEYMREKPLSSYYDEVLLPALALAHYDVLQGRLDGPKRAQIRLTIDEVLDDLADYEDAMPPKKSRVAAVPPTGGLEVPSATTVEPEPPLAPNFEPADLPAAWQGKPVLCIASRTELDEAVAAVLADLLGKHNIGALVLPWEAASPANLQLLDLAPVQIVCICGLDSSLMTHVRFLVKRFRKKIPDATIIVALWTPNGDELARSDRLEGTGADIFVGSMREALVTICRAVAEASKKTAASVC